MVESVSPKDVMEMIFDRELCGSDGLNTHQINSYTETVKAYKDNNGLRGAVVLGNNAAFNHSQYPTGQVLHFDPYAPVDPMTLNPNSFECISMCKILPELKQRFDDKFFLEKLGALQSIEQYTTDPITLELREDDNYDNDYWKAEIGQSGAVDVCKRKRGARSHDYFIIAKAAAPLVGQQIIDELKQDKINGEIVSWGDFVNGKKMKYWKNAASRNADRLALLASEKLHVEIETTEEVGTYTETDNQAAHLTAQSMMAPNIRQFISSIGMSFGKGANQHVVSQYSHCIPASACKDKYCLVACSPFHGFVGVKMGEDFKPSKGVVPTTTGRCANSATLDYSKIDEQDLEDIDTQYTWEGKPDQLAAEDVHDKLHPGAYRKFDDEFITQNFMKQGMKEKSYQQYIPVISKVGARKPRQVQKEMK